MEKMEQVTLIEYFRFVQLQELQAKNRRLRSFITSFYPDTQRKAYNNPVTKYQKYTQEKINEYIQNLLKINLINQKYNFLNDFDITQEPLLKRFGIA